jgi:glycosyltransferase involved in cell wall biosynthesis
MTPRTRLAIVASHPIQYFVPYYRALAQNAALDVRVLFASKIGIERKLDPEMGVEIAWKMDLTGGYAHEFLVEADRITRTGLRQVNNPSVTAALLRIQPEVVILHGYGMMTMLRALAWCRARRIPAIMTSDSSTHSTGPGLRRLLKLLMMPVLLRQYSAFLTMSERGEDYLASLGVCRRQMFRSPMLLPEQFWSIRQKREAVGAEMRAQLGLRADDVVLLYVGKIYPGKRVGDIFAALQQLRRDGLDLKRVNLIIAGDGEQRTQLEAAAAVAQLPTQFLGFVNIDELPRYYCAADVLVHPAEIEQYGMVVLEAAVLGLPLILSDRVGAIGATSIARPGANALVYGCGDRGALASAIRRLIEEPCRRRRMAEASLRFSLDHDGAKSVASTLAAVDACLRIKPQAFGAARHEALNDTTRPSTGSGG